MTATEIAPAIRNEIRMQERVSCKGRKDAADIKSFTSPAAIPLKKYTGSRIRSAAPVARIDSKKNSCPRNRFPPTPSKSPGITQALYILSLKRSVNTAPVKNNIKAMAITIYPFRDVLSSSRKRI